VELGDDTIFSKHSCETIKGWLTAEKPQYYQVGAETGFGVLEKSVLLPFEYDLQDFICKLTQVVAAKIDQPLVGKSVMWAQPITKTEAAKAADAFQLSKQEEKRDAQAWAFYKENVLKKDNEAVEAMLDKPEVPTDEEEACCVLF